MGAITRWIEAVNQSVGDWSSFIYLAVFAITIYDVGARYLFNAPTIWGLELVIALAGIHYMMAGAVAVKNDTHVRIDFIFRLLPRRTQLVLTLAANLISLLFLGAIVYFGAQQAETSILGGERTGAGWNSRAPMWMKLAIPVGAALMILQVLVNFGRTLRELRLVR